MAFRTFCAFGKHQNTGLMALTIALRFGWRVCRAHGDKAKAAMASKTNPFTFIQQVRDETAKVTWPSRRETMVSTLMVFAMATLAAIFFFAADQLMAFGIEVILGIGS